MNATLDALQALQQVALKLNALRSKIEQKKRRVRLYEKRFAEREAELLAKHDASIHRQSEMGQLELEMKSAEVETTKLREALNKSKTNREYAALLMQINTGKADMSKLEDSILERMSALETMKEEEERIKSAIEDERRSLKNSGTIAEAFERESDSEVKALALEYEEVSSTVPPATLGVFQRVAERHDGEALARVLQPHLKQQEFICSGCNMSVTLEQYVVLQAGSDIQVCQSCGRVLFLDEHAA